MTDTFIHPDLYHHYEQDPITMVDIGAAGGLLKRWDPASHFLKVVAFEPDEEAFQELIGKAPEHLTYVNAALYKCKATVDFHVTRKRQASSLLLPNRGLLDRFPSPERFDILRTVRVGVDTLDSQLSAHDVASVDFLTLDTQGTELYILQGAERTLEKVFGVELEVEFNEMYEGQPLFGDIDRFMRQRGFGLFTLNRARWKRYNGRVYETGNGQMICGDALYLKTASSFAKQLREVEDGSGRSRFLKGLSICSLYDFVDYAEELWMGNRRLLSSSEADRVEDWFEQQAVAMIPAHKTQRGLGVLLRFLSLLQKVQNRLSRYGSRPRTEDWYRNTKWWAVSDRELGL